MCTKSRAEAPNDRKAHDLQYVEKICNIERGVIKKCIRAGKPLDELRDRPRLLIVTVPSPDIASELHKYRNGCKVRMDGLVHWINPDLTQHDRKLNFEARQGRRALQQSNTNRRYSDSIKQL